MDWAKIKAIEKLPSPTLMKRIQCFFFKHVGFYKKFIKDLSNIMKPLYMLLEKDIPFMFDEKCILTFQTLKSALVFILIIITSDWNSPFKIMCDVSDYAIGVVLGRKKRQDLLCHLLCY